MKNVPLDWALGAFILQARGASNISNHGWIASLTSENYSNLFFFLVAVNVYCLLYLLVEVTIHQNYLRFGERTIHSDLD